MGIGFLFGIETDRDDGGTTLLIYSVPLTGTLSNVLSDKFYALCILL